MKLQFRYLFMAAVAHVLLIVLLVAVVDMSHLKLGDEKKQQSIQMRLADGPVETTSQRNEKQALERKRIAEKRAREERELELKAQQEARVRAEEKADQLRKQEAAEKQAIAAEHKKAELEKQRLAKKKQDEADRKLAEEKQRQQAQAAEKKAAEEKAAEEKRRKEAAEKAKADAERKRKADELAKKTAAEAAERKRVEAAAAAQRAAEQQAFTDSLAAEETERELNGVRNAWGAAIKRRVTDNWKRPYTNLERIECDLEVTLMASGEVLEAKIVRSSGDVGIDESVKKALLRSSPLPLPSDMRAFQKEIIFEFRSN